MKNLDESKATVVDPEKVEELNWYISDNLPENKTFEIICMDGKIGIVTAYAISRDDMKQYLNKDGNSNRIDGYYEMVYAALVKSVWFIEKQLDLANIDFYIQHGSKTTNHSVLVFIGGDARSSDANEVIKILDEKLYASIWTNFKNALMGIEEVEVSIPFPVGKLIAGTNHNPDYPEIYTDLIPSGSDMRIPLALIGNNSDENLRVAIWGDMRNDDYTLSHVWHNLSDIVNKEVHL